MANTASDQCAWARLGSRIFCASVLALSSGFEGTGDSVYKSGHRRPWLNDSGLEWRNDAEFGNTLGLHSELRQPVTNDHQSDPCALRQIQQ